MTRASVTSLRDDPSAEVLIIGGGINGIATFRELSLQGVKVALVERGDFVSGASSASSHMVHGGVRYLENGEFRLVNEAVHERNRLLKNAPHYVRPLETTIPVFSTFSGILAAPLRFLTHKQRTTVERGAVLIKVGLSLYDSFSRGGGTVPRHRFLRRKYALEDMPELNPDLKYTATYYDASMHDPERLALDVLQDGIQTGSARATNYVEAIGFTGDGVLLQDKVTGESFTFSAKVVVNTTGPWTDLTNESLGQPSRFMGGTKGSHIVVNNQDLLRATRGRELFFENDDGRIVLIYPIKNRVLIGTTDIEADPRRPAVCTEEEVDYFFKLVRHVLPRIQLHQSEIVYRFAGIRPLPRHDDESPGFVSRDYRIEASTLGDGIDLLSLVGGKWTTFRALGEHLADEVLGKLQRPRTVSTESLAIGGGKQFPTTAAHRSGWITKHAESVDTQRAEELLERYGTKAAAVIATLPKSDAPLTHAPQYSTGEIRYLASTENVVHLSDLVYRRTSLAFVGGLSEPLLQELSVIVGTVLGWDPQQQAAEVALVADDLSLNHEVQLTATSADAPRTHSAR